jgi:hypothetical protein
MNSANDWGVYQPEQTEELYRRGNAVATFKLCQCDDDGLFRFSTSLNYSYGGYAGPICADDKGFESAALARDAAIAEVLAWLATDRYRDPQSARNELQAMRDALEEMMRQPSLF